MGRVLNKKGHLPLPALRLHSPYCGISNSVSLQWPLRASSNIRREKATQVSQCVEGYAQQLLAKSIREHRYEQPSGYFQGTGARITCLTYVRLLDSKSKVNNGY